MLFLELLDAEKLVFPRLCPSFLTLTVLFTSDVEKEAMK